MKTKKKKKRETLLRFFNKRVSSFLANFQKARMTGYVTDIHNSRVEMKKILTLVSLFEKVGKENGVLRNRSGVFRELFRQSGKVREIQLNLKALEKFHPGDYGLISFRHDLEREEKKCMREFICTASKFKIGKLEKISVEVTRLIREMDTVRFRLVAKKFLDKKTEKIRLLQSDLQDISNSHKIRKHLKSIATVVTAMYLLKPEERAIKQLAELNRSEKMIGAWHDQVVFLDSIDKYIKNTQSDEPSGISINQLREKVNEQAALMFGQFSADLPV
jgi:CHAD domain-containing protein